MYELLLFDYRSPIKKIFLLEGDVKFSRVYHLNVEKQIRWVQEMSGGTI